MNRPVGNRKGINHLLASFALVIVGIGIALGMMELLLRTFPNWIPPEVRVNPPVRRVQAFLDKSYDLRHSDGDLFHLMQGSIAPLSAEENQVTAHIHMTTDAHGFRNSPPEKDTYGIVALGDSFTRASGVAVPWPQKLAECTGNDVLNLGDVGFGPQDELAVLQKYGLEKHPKLVILAYFEGNDLYDAASYETATPFILARFGKYMLGNTIQTLRERKTNSAQAAIIPSIDQAAVSSSYRYPIIETINHQDLKIVFFSSYISWLALSRETIAASRNYQLVTELIVKMRDLSEAAGANFLLVYVPSKSHVYLPFLKDPATVASVFSDVPLIELGDTGFLNFSDKTATPELTRQHMDDQAGLMSDFAAQQQIPFLDLTTPFQQEAGAGAELYYPFDTHWNQLGHDLAAETITTYIEDELQATTMKIPGH